MLPHFSVHGRREQNRRARRERDRGQRMTGESVRQLRDDVRRRGSDEEKIWRDRRARYARDASFLFRRRNWS